MQGAVLEWAQKKLDLARSEHTELEESWTEAKARKWKHSAIQRAAGRALKRITFYEKVVAALKGGFMLFPPVDKADVIAIRTERSGDRQIREVSFHGKPALHESDTEAPPIGEGEWKSPWQGWMWWNSRENDKGNTLTQWQLDTELEDAEFPVSMARPEIIRATTAAMEQKFFDEIRLFPFTKRRGDPVLLGCIVDKSTKHDNRKLFFCIAWHIKESDI